MIALNIRHIAQNKKVTLKEISEYCGVSPHGFQKMLDNDDFKTSTLIKIADFLAVPIESLFYGELSDVLKPSSNQKNRIVLQIEMDENKNLRIAPGKDLFDLIT